MKKSEAMRDGGALDTRKLRYFYEVARLQSFRLAGRHLGVSQPSLTRHIQTLETELGVVLLQRGQRATRLTEAGELLFDHAEHLLHRLAEARAAVAGMGNFPTGTVTLALPASFAMAFLPSFLVQFKNRYPAVRLRVTEGSTRHVEDWLASGYAQLGVVVSDTASSSLVSEHLATEDLFFVGAQMPERLGTGPLSMAEIVDLPLVLPLPPHGSRRLIDDAAAAAGVQLNPWFEVDSPHIMRQVILAHGLFAIMPKLAIRSELAAGALMAVPLSPPPRRTLGLATLRGEALSAATRALAQDIRLAVRNLEVG